MSRERHKKPALPVVASVVCAACGTLEIAVSDLTVVTSMEAELLVCFRCPLCDAWVEQVCDAKIRPWLLAGGAILGLVPSDEAVATHKET